MAPNLIQAQGGQPQKPTRFVSLFTSRFLSGLFTNRSPLRGPLQAMYSDYYHLGATDALIDGLNSELSIRQTMIRRPGNVAFSSGTTAGAVDNFYSFHKADGTITVIADSTVDVETVTPGLITSIFTKATGAGQGYFQGINKSLYIADGIDAVKYIPGTLNPDTGKPVWNMSGVAPTVAPTLTTTITGSAGVSWIASTVFSTMGFIFDSGTGTIQQLTRSTPTDPTHPQLPRTPASPERACQTGTKDIFKRLQMVPLHGPTSDRSFFGNQTTTMLAAIRSMTPAQSVYSLRPTTTTLRLAACIRHLRRHWGS